MRLYVVDRTRFQLASWLCAAALGLLLFSPPPVEAQGERPSIRISGGHVYIDGRHAGSIGASRDPHATGRLIRGRLLELGDPRAVRFGPGRVGEASGFTRYPWWIHPRTVHPRVGHRRAFHPGFFHPGQRGFPHHGAGFVIVLHHPFGAVWVGHRIGWWRWMQTTSVTAGAPLFVVPAGEDAAGRDQEDPGVQDQEARRPPRDRPAPRPRPAPYEPPLERCADVTVSLLAGTTQRVRVDLATLDADTAEEARAALDAQLRYEGRLDVRGSRGDGLVAPAAVIRSLDVAACEA